MITLIDSTGQEVDPALYRERLIVPAAKQEEIREWVAEAEQRIQDPSNEAKAIQEFLCRFTYTQNLLEQPYQPAAASVAEIAAYVPSFRDDWLAESINQKLYLVEKIARLGVPVQLSAEDQRAIVRAEDYFYEAGSDKPLRLIKMLGRHAKLGLSDIDPERKENLQRMLNSDIIFRDWLGCTALRAGFTLPPCPADAIEYRIRGYIEQEPLILKEILIFGYKIYNQEKHRQMMQDREKQLEVYVNGVHHLKRLFGEG